MRALRDLAIALSLANLYFFGVWSDLLPNPPRHYHFLVPPHPFAFIAIMLNVHRSGQGLAGVYTHDVAETKLKATRQAAEEHEFPLLVTMEPEETSE